MKKLWSITLALVLLFTMNSVMISGAEDYGTKEGYDKVWDFENFDAGSAASLGIYRSSGALTGTISTEWAATGSKSVKFDSATATYGCIQFDHPTAINFTQAAGKDYSSMVFAVKVPNAPATGANEKGYSLMVCFNDWGVYYGLLHNGDQFMIKGKNDTYWSKATISDKALMLPYGFEGLVKFDLNTMYKGSNLLPEDATTEELDAVRLKYGDIQHELVLEFWAADTTGGANGPLYLDDMYLRETSATDVFEEEPAFEDGPKLLNNFEGFNVGDNLIKDDGSADGIWNGYDCIVKSSDLNVGDGTRSAEFNAELRRTFGTIGLIKTSDGNVKGKDYFIMHITTPPVTSSKSPAYKDENGVARFMIAFIPKTITGNGTVGHWFKTNANVAGNIMVMADGQATWKNADSADYYSFLPFGWSGWIRYDIDTFTEGELVLDGETPLSGIEINVSQIGGTYGKVYMDAFYALDSDDEIEAGISASGNKNGTDTVAVTPTTEPTVTNAPADSEDPTPTQGTETDEDSSPTTSDAGLPVAAMIIIAITSIGVIVGTKFKKVQD